MSRSKLKSVKIPQLLADAAEGRAKDLGYPSFNAYVTGLIRYDLVSLKDHTLTGPIAGLNLDHQDKVDSEIAQLYRTGEGLKGQWLERLIERTVAALVEKNPDASPEEIEAATKDALGGIGNG